ncbi:MAG TPA: SHOCT domain-containing protein [Dehalococcoidia bacterium]|nr:SHOCT domain-containing protein [Dehalococcoidia bacterium]
MWHMGDGWGWWMVFAWIWAAVFWGLIIWGIVTIVNRTSEGAAPGGRRDAGQDERSALDILERRYASGELTEEDFERMRDRIVSPRGP